MSSEMFTGIRCSARTGLQWASDKLGVGSKTTHLGERWKAGLALWAEPLHNSQLT